MDSMGYTFDISGKRDSLDWKNSPNIEHDSKIHQKTNLVGGFNPSEKYARQIGSFPQVGVKMKNI